MGIEPTLEARRAALRFLKLKDYSRSELRAKLAAKEFEPEVIEQTLDWLERHRWLSERRLAERLEERLTCEEPSGWLRIESEFRRRGLKAPPELADPQRELERAVRALNLKFGTPPPESHPKQITRWLAFLARRGFEPETAQTALQRWNPGISEGEEREDWLA